MNPPAWVQVVTEGIAVAYVIDTPADGENLL